MQLEGKTVQRGLWFIHKRYITKTPPRVPEVCCITKVTALSVYYRVGGPTGSLVQCSLQYFREQSFLRWSNHG